MELGGYLLHRENSNKKNPCEGKHREFRFFVETQGIWFAEVDSKGKLILKVKDISIIAEKNF